MVGGIPTIRTHSSQILKMDLAKPTLQLGTHTQIYREFIRFKFALTRMNCHDEARRRKVMMFQFSLFKTSQQNETIMNLTSKFYQQEPRLLR